MKKLLLLMFLGTCLITACSEKSKDENPTPGTPLEELGCLLEEIYRSDDESETTTSLTYDEDGNITKIEEVDVYVEDGVTGTYISDIRFTYADGKLLSSEAYAGYDEEDLEVFEETVYSYDGDVISKITQTYDEEGLTFTYEYRLIYTDGQLTKVEGWSNSYYNESSYSVGDLYLDEVSELTYQNGNIIKIVDKEFEGEAGETVDYIETIEITYDDKINPVKGNLGWFIWEHELDQLLSDNNPLTYTYTEDGELTESESITYSYNDDNIPTMVTRDYGDNDIEEYELTYQCN